MRTLPCLFILTLAACSGAAGGGTGTGTASTDQPAQDDNVRFVIPAVDNSNVTTPDTGPVVKDFTAADAQSYQIGGRSGIAGINAEIVINSTVNACADANTNAYHAGEAQLVIVLTDIPDGTMATNTYVYPAAANAPYEIASATYAYVTAPCSYASVNVVSGQVQLTDVQPTTMSGTYTLQFASGTLTGSFTAAPSCNALASTPVSAPNCPAP